MAETLPLTERLDWLQLARSEGVGPKTLYRLLHKFRSARRAFEEFPSISAENDGRERKRCQRDQVEAELDGIAALGAMLCAHGEPSYPQLLSEIHDPPPLQTVLGNPEILHGDTVAIVGARNASANGRLLAKMFAEDLAVVSGLARDVDTAAHEDAIMIETADSIREALRSTMPIRTPMPIRTEPATTDLGAECSRQPAKHVSLPSVLVPKAETLPGPSTSSFLDKVYERLGTEPLLVDELIRQCHASSSEMQHALFELELEGRIERHPGNRVSLASS